MYDFVLIDINAKKVLTANIKGLSDCFNKSTIQTNTTNTISINI